jgi:hypothetical protein
MLRRIAALEKEAAELRRLAERLAGLIDLRESSAGPDRTDDPRGPRAST